VEFLESRVFQLVLLISLFYALVFDDFATIVCGKNTDGWFDGVTLAVIAIFVIEILISCIFITGYTNSYYFYLDLISMFSMFVDLNMVKIALNNIG